MEGILDRTFMRACEETRAVFSTRSETPSSTVFFARLADLARSNSFLWVEAGLKVQERRNRATPAGWSLSRTLLLATLATDIYAGYLALSKRARWCPALVSPRDWELQHQRSANRVLDTAASLGGALIKACQFASTRPDLLPSAYIRTLSRLQDRLPPHPWSTIEAALTRELGRRPQEVFARIEPEPIAAASIAQVHRARLRDGREVAVKIQYPEIRNLVAADLPALGRIIEALARATPTIRLQPILDYLEKTLPLELDFRREAKAMSDLRAALQHRADVLVPQAITELSTERLLVMEFIEGIKITDRAALLNKNISLRAVAQLLNDLYAEQILRLGILHADPHPGNLFVQPGPKLVLLDHGLTVRLSPTLVHALAGMVRALVAGDFDALSRALAEAGLQLARGVDITTLLQLVGVLLGGSGGQDNNPVDIGSQLGKSVGRIPVNLILVGRALGVLDGITKQLDPQLDALEIVANYT